MQYIFWKDSKFWLALFDGLVSLALFFVGKYSSASVLEDVKMGIVFIQPLFVIIIGSIFAGEIMAFQNGILPRHFKE